MFRKEILQIFVGAFHSALDIGDLNILDAIISRAIEYHWQFMDLLAPFRLSWRKTSVILRLHLFTATRYTLEKLELLINYNRDEKFIRRSRSIVFVRSATRNHVVISR